MPNFFLGGISFLRVTMKSKKVVYIIMIQLENYKSETETKGVHKETNEHRQNENKMIYNK